MWQRYNGTTKIFEKSVDNGVSWAALGLDAAIITQGSLADARLSANIPKLNAANVFSVPQTVSVPNTIGVALGIRYNALNSVLGFNIANSNGYPYLGFNLKAQVSSDVPLYEATGTPVTQLRMDSQAFAFLTAPSGIAGNTPALTESARVNSVGFAIGTTASIVWGSRLAVRCSHSVNMMGIEVQTLTNAVGGIFIDFVNAAGAIQGSVSATSSTTAGFNTTSDKRLKKDLGIAKSIDVLRDTIIHDFEWIPNGMKDRGVFAQEAVKVHPPAITIGSDKKTPDGQIAHPWMADYSKYVPDLVVGWQEHEGRIAKLEKLISKD